MGCCASFAEQERRKKKKIQVLPLSGSGCRQSFSKAFTSIPIENNTWISMVRVRKLIYNELLTCNVLRLWIV